MRFLIFLLAPFILFSQEASEKEELFLALYTIGERWDTLKSPNEQQYFKAHSAFLGNLRKDESITIGARYGETGMIVFKAKDLASAKALIASDVAVKNHLFNVAVHTFAPFYKGCIE